VAAQSRHCVDGANPCECDHCVTARQLAEPVPPARVDAAGGRTISWRGEEQGFDVLRRDPRPARQRDLYRFEGIPPKVRRIMRLRSITTLLLFAVAAVAALNEPVSEKADG
jgi:hypothetical protein